MTKTGKQGVFFVALLLSVVLLAGNGYAGEGLMAADSASSAPWWMWPLLLLVVTFVMGVAAVLGGVRSEGVV